MEPGVGAAFGGRFVRAAATTVGSRSRSGRIAGAGAAGRGATVAPAAPAGSIAIAATRDSLTATGGRLHLTSARAGRVRKSREHRHSDRVSARAGPSSPPTRARSFRGFDLATGADGRASVALMRLHGGPDNLSAATDAGDSRGTMLSRTCPRPRLRRGLARPAAVSPENAAPSRSRARTRDRAHPARHEPDPVFRAWSEKVAVFGLTAAGPSEPAT